VPSDHGSLATAQIEVAVRSLADARSYYGHSLGFEEVEAGVFICGETRLLVAEHATATRTSPMRAPGYRYLTVQVWDADAEYARIVERGGEGAMPPRTMGNVARFGFVRDPDGNWLEISQRASLTGPLPQN
jgi:lactoylglutathione lyase